MGPNGLSKAIPKVPGGNKCKGVKGDDAWLLPELGTNKLISNLNAHKNGGLSSGTIEWNSI